MTVTLLACGSRKWGVMPRGIAADNYEACLRKAEKERAIEEDILTKFLLDFGTDLFIIQGAAAGADTIAYLWALREQVPFKGYPADWATYGRSAGPRRNRQMLEEGQPDFVVAFSYLPVSTGTANMVKIARAAGVPTKVYPDNDA